jgi:hypothetical protein
VKTRFRSLPFKCNSHRYTAACLEALVFAVCRHVEVVSEHHEASAAATSSANNDTASATNDASGLGMEGANEDCFNDGGLMFTAGLYTLNPVDP